jgi:hypothetical protein
VKHNVATLDRTRQDFGVADTAPEELDLGFRVFEIDLSTTGEVIEHVHFKADCEQTIDEVAPNEARPARHQSARPLKTGRHGAP